MERKGGIANTILQRGLELVVSLIFVLLLLVETGYVVWLDRLPAFSTPDHSNSGFALLPAWYENPKAPRILLLTIAGGMTVWMGIELFTVMRRKRLGICRNDVKLAVIGRLKTALFWTVLAGADLLFIQLVRT